MSWTPEQRRRYAPAISEAVRADATVRLATTIDPAARTGRPRLAALRLPAWPEPAGSDAPSASVLIPSAIRTW